MVEALEEVVYKPVKIYDEVAPAINSLTGECNEFQSYCTGKGGTATLTTTTAGRTSSMEEVVTRAYTNCLETLCRPEDKETLTARYNYVLHVISSAKMGIKIDSGKTSVHSAISIALKFKTSSGRVTALCASALLHLSRLPNTLTPLIKSLMDLIEWEEIGLLADQILRVAFPSLIAFTSERVPCPHAKIFKQLCSGIVCERSTPKSDQWCVFLSSYDIFVLVSF